MIQLDYKNEKIYIAQQTTPPVVYLDQWAFKKIVLEDKEGEVFINLIKEKKGTLVISYMNLMEFALVTDDSHIEKIESFLNGLSPDNIGFIEVNPDVVIKKEDEILKTGATIAPHQDRDLLHTFMGKNSNEVWPYSFNGFLKLLRGPVLKEKNDKFMEGSAHLLEELRLKNKNSPMYQKELKGALIQHPTRYVAYDIFGQLVTDSAMKMEVNDWKDFLHSIVPISYCEIILLDRGWVHKANRAIERLKKLGLMTQNPHVYALKDMSDFWNKLKSWQ